MSWFRCGNCRTLVDSDRYARCYVCGTEKGASLPPLPATPVERPIRPPRAEPILAQDAQRSVVGSAVLAIIGAIGVWNLALRLRDERGIVVILGVMVLLGICIWVAHLGRGKDLTFNSAGKVTLQVFSAIGVCVLTLASLAVAGVVLLFVVCASGGWGRL